MKSSIHIGDFKVTKDMVTKGRFNQKLSDEIVGDFKCSLLNLTTLEGCPRKISGKFICYKNKLTSLEGGPEVVGKTYSVTSNLLTNLKGIAKEIGENLTLERNQLTSLDGCPKEVNSFSCSYNLLSTLKGGPEIVKEDYYCNNNKLTSLKGSPKIIYGKFNCNENNLTTLKGGPNKVKNLYCHSNNLENLLFCPEVEELIITNLYEESMFIKHKGINNIINYWSELLKFILNDKKYDISKVNWPISFIETLDENIKNTIKSLTTINRFKL